MILTKVQLDIAKEIINIGLARAADSLSFFVKNKILLRDFDVKIQSISELDKISEKSGDQIHVLTTELKGSMGGVCFLLIDQEDSKVLFDAALPESIKNDPEKVQKMGIPFLLEIDNIVTAAVVTQLSNIFQSDLYGYVPEHQLCKEKKLNEILKKRIGSESFIFYIAVRFDVPDSMFCPEFIWALDNKFIEGIKQFMDNPSNASIIQSMSN